MEYTGGASARCTCKRGRSLTSSGSGMALNWGPSKASPPSVRMPHSLAMCLAVCTLSPVTILTTMPARLQVATASGTSFLTGSCTAGPCFYKLVGWTHQHKQLLPVTSLASVSACYCVWYLSPKRILHRRAVFPHIVCCRWEACISTKHCCLSPSWPPCHLACRSLLHLAPFSSQDPAQ